MTDILICVVGLVISHGIVYFAGLVAGMGRSRGDTPADHRGPRTIRAWSGDRTLAVNIDPCRTWEISGPVAAEVWLEEPIHVDTRGEGARFAELLEARGRSVVRERG